ncbi:hypothetical protein [Emticicia sp. 17c]|uniref:hypothetical protein n=1 Tax=Emticicia sp. 17c TaxID=3127704 RepID=UPI00301CA40E
MESLNQEEQKLVSQMLAALTGFLKAQRQETHLHACSITFTLSAKERYTLSNALNKLKL